jgi:eukaryotic-like serine/threonine-protein kinase
MPETLDRLQIAVGANYRIQRELGAGGMATVYLARDLKHDRDVAIKVLKPELGAVLGADRFLSEIKVTANLRHPNLLPLFDSGEADGLLYYVMPYIEGQTLRERLTAERQLPISEVVRLVGLLAGALDYAHAAKVVHRDLKPENILLQAGQPVIADFGIALAVAQAGGERITQTGLSLGTPLYMSPEQASGDRGVDARTDQYALAAMTYEMITGEPPHNGATAQVIISRLMTEKPRSTRNARPSVPPSTDAAVLRALSKSPADRFPNCSDFARALSTEDQQASTRSRGLFWSLAAAALVVVVAVLVFTRRGGPARAVDPTGRTSVAVLPFEDLSPDRKSEYFGDGIAETLISALGRVAGLDVAARTSAFSFRGKNVDVRQIGSTLGVTTVLEGSVQRAGDKLRITAQLVKAADGVSLWSETFDRSATDIFAVQDEVAQAVITALKGKVLASSARGPSTATHDPQAYDLYLQGRFYQGKRTTAEVRRAIGLFEQAIARDSLFAQAWTGLADAYVVQAYYSNVPAIATLKLARQAVDRALAIDPQLGEAQITRAYLLHNDWNWPAADSAFQRAFALVPGYAVGHKWYADVLFAEGRDAEADKELARSRELDPLSAGNIANLAGRAWRQGDFTLAERLLSQAFALDPTQPHALRTMTSLMIDKSDSARFFDAQQRFAASSDLAGAPAAELRTAWQRGGRDAVIRAQIAAFDRLGLPFEAGRWRMKAGDLDGMFRDLDRAFDERVVWMPAVKWYFNSPAATKDPRFGALLARLRIPPDAQ